MLDAGSHLKHLELALENLTEGVIFFDASKRITKMNKEALKLHGFSSEQTMHEAAEDFLQSLSAYTLDFELIEFND